MTTPTRVSSTSLKVWSKTASRSHCPLGTWTSSVGEGRCNPLFTILLFFYVCLLCLCRNDLVKILMKCQFKKKQQQLGSYSLRPHLECVVLINCTSSLKMNEKSQYRDLTFLLCKLIHCTEKHCIETNIFESAEAMV